jgi:hypothetical protein
MVLERGLNGRIALSFRYLETGKGDIIRDKDAVFAEVFRVRVVE